MRKALPIWHCLSREAQDKLAKIAKSNEELFSTLPPDWVEWDKLGESPKVQATYDNIDYAKFMRQRPQHLRKVNW